LGTYLSRIAMCEALTWCRYTASRRETLIDQEPLHNLQSNVHKLFDPEQAAWFKEAEQRVIAWETAINPDNRRLLSLWKEGKSQISIGNLTGRSQATISATLGRLKQELCDLLGSVRP
jgi:DNA-directed RNA polymerase specialized sigma24 family protein